MRFDVMTLFPDLFTPFLEQGVTRRAFTSAQVAVHVWDVRDFAQGHYRRVDDRPFGGGPGMVLMPEPLQACLQHIRQHRSAHDAQHPTSPALAPVVLFSPIGTTLKHAVVEHWAQQSTGAILVCGRYEGIDQRFIDAYVDVQISLGDFVLSGGEIAALAFLDAITRLQPGVLNDQGSHQQDSFNPALDGLLDAPHYTRPERWHSAQGEREVPQVLLSGHHAHIQRWRREQSLRLSAQHRPELITAAREQQRLNRQDEAFLQHCTANTHPTPATLDGMSTPDTLPPQTKD